MSEAGWSIVFVLGLVLAGTAVLVVVIRQIFKTAQFKAAAGSGELGDEEYRRIAEQVAAVRRQNAPAAPRSDVEQAGRNEAEEGR